MLTIKSTREGPLYWLPLELKLAELEPEKDLAPESELDVTEDIENEVGLLALTSLCPAVEDELDGGDPPKVRVPSLADETAERRRRRRIGANIFSLISLF